MLWPNRFKRNRYDFSEKIKIKCNAINLSGWWLTLWLQFTHILMIDHVNLLPVVIFQKNNKQTITIHHIVVHRVSLDIQHVSISNWISIAGSVFSHPVRKIDTTELSVLSYRTLFVPHSIVFLFGSLFI